MPLYLCLHWLAYLLFHNIYKDTIKKYALVSCKSRGNIRTYTPEFSRGTIFLFLNHKQSTKVFHIKYLCLYLPSNQLGHAMPLTLLTRIQCQASLCGIQGGQSGTGTVISRSTLVSPGHCHCINAQYLFIHLSQVLHNLGS